MNDLMCDPRQGGDEKGQKNRAVAALVAAGVLIAVIQILTPFAKEYGWKRFDITPFYLLQYVLWPFALTLLGWGIAKAGKAFGIIRIWEGHTERTVRIFQLIFYVSAAILAVFAILGLWTAVDLMYRLWQSERMMRLQESFDFSTVPQLMPWWLQSIYMQVIVIYRLGGAGLFLGAALGLFGRKKEPDRKKQTEGLD